ncbi:hypothetical protein BD413DRAFT_489925 [Trametes elegans]|nr:hypothetical protein BD413DRAFT_489925 [Trametes elegans]
MLAKVILFVCALFALANAAALQDESVEKRGVGDFFSDITAGAASIYSGATSKLQSKFGDKTTLPDGYGAFETTIASQKATVIFNTNGQAITVAPSGYGTPTAFASATYSAVTGDAAAASSVFAQAGSQKKNAASGAHGLSMSGPLLGCLMTALASMFLGAWVAL